LICIGLDSVSDGEIFLQFIWQDSTREMTPSVGLTVLGFTCGKANELGRSGRKENGPARERKKKMERKGKRESGPVGKMGQRRVSCVEKEKGKGLGQLRRRGPREF
jgi:hypothetical protein